MSSWPRSKDGRRPASSRRRPRPRSPPKPSRRRRNASRRSRLERTTTSRPSSTPLRSSSATRRSEEHTSELQSTCNLVCRLLLEKKKPRHYSGAPEKKPVSIDVATGDLPCGIEVGVVVGGAAVLLHLRGFQSEIHSAKAMGLDG